MKCDRMSAIEPDVETLQRCQHELALASRPFVEMLSTVYTMAMPYMIIDRAGHFVENGYRFTSEQQEVLDKTRRLWDETKRGILESYGIAEVLKG